MADSDHLAAGIDLPRSRQAGIREIERREVSSVEDIPVNIEVPVRAPVTDDESGRDQPQIENAKWFVSRFAFSCLGQRQDSYESSPPYEFASSGIPLTAVAVTAKLSSKRDQTGNQHNVLRVTSNEMILTV